MKPHQPQLSFIPFLCPGIGIWSVGFLKNPEKNARSKTRANSKLIPHIGTGPLNLSLNLFRLSTTLRIRHN